MTAWDYLSTFFIGLSVALVLGTAIGTIVLIIMEPEEGEE